MSGIDTSRVEVLEHFLDLAAHRQGLIADTTNDPLLRALGVRLETADPDGDAWVESLAALVARRPPELWNDGDLPAFEAVRFEEGAAQVLRD
jgi:hypothetical protein